MKWEVGYYRDGEGLYGYTSLTKPTNKEIQDDREMMNFGDDVEVSIVEMPDDN